MSLRLPALLFALAAVIVAACASVHAPAGAARWAGLARLSGGFGDRALTNITATMDPAMLALAQRHDPRPHKQYWGRVAGWEKIDLAVLPTLGLTGLTFDEARQVNSYLPIVEPPQPAPRFLLTASADDRARAERCLAQAVYYEAGFEPPEGKRAVAQVVLNRLRHAGYPKSVCGVVYQGAQAATGCQFSFTCDGSLARPVSPVAWADAQVVAMQALGGYVAPEVGAATHYHADYVSPYWAPTLVKLAQVGQHIFYRWTGPQGGPGALTGRYAGGEAVLSAAVLESDDARTPNQPQAAAPKPEVKTVQLDQGNGVMRTFVVTDANTRVTGGVDVPAPGVGVLSPTRRKPTRAEVDAINAALAKLPEAQPRTASGQAAAAPQ